MQLTCTAWVESLTLRDDGRGKHTHHVRNISLYHYDFLTDTGRSVLGVLFVTSTVLATYKRSVLSRVQNTITVEPSVFLMVTNKGDRFCPSANYCQGQLQTPQSG